METCTLQNPKGQLGCRLLPVWLLKARGRGTNGARLLGRSLLT